MLTLIELCDAEWAINELQGKVLVEIMFCMKILRLVSVVRETIKIKNTVRACYAETTTESEIATLAMENANELMHDMNISLPSKGTKIIFSFLKAHGMLIIREMFSITSVTLW